MFTMEDKNNERYFVSTCFSPSACKKMESALFHRAKVLLLHRLVYKAYFNNVLTELNRYQDMLVEEYPRWKRVNCRFSYGLDGVFWLYIGEGSSFTLLKVLGEY